MYPHPSWTNRHSPSATSSDTLSDNCPSRACAFHSHFHLRPGAPPPSTPPSATAARNRWRAASPPRDVPIGRDGSTRGGDGRRRPRRRGRGRRRRRRGCCSCRSCRRSRMPIGGERPGRTRSTTPFVAARAIFGGCRATWSSVAGGAIGDRRSPRSRCGGRPRRRGGGRIRSIGGPRSVARGAASRPLLRRSPLRRGRRPVRPRERGRSTPRDPRTVSIPGVARRRR
mmetsp:Transcript_23623/g.49987  ORF Transcript_23623/g.49987 Transcript_23623/m.49987 type:complete len:227 (+) Transcript_23623:869-1549(+)